MEVFLKFFMDPSRSGKYHLTPQHHADIVVWMIRHYYLPNNISVMQFQSGDGKTNIQTPLARLLSGYQYGDNLRNQTMVIPLDIYLSHASRCAEQLIEIIRSYNSDTFPFMVHSMVCGKVVVQYYS